MDGADPLLQQQIAYYRARAGEYDEWFYRQGRYDQGEELNRQWFADVSEAEQALADFAPTGRVLELACGTGLWTNQLVRSAGQVTAVDAAPEVLAINRARVDGASVRYQQADLFRWQPDERYDVVFFSFWLSHVPPERFAPFWRMVGQALAPGGRVFFMDSLYAQAGTARDQRLAGPEATTSLRRLNDGREYQIVKVFYQPEELAVRLRELGWHAAVHAARHGLLFYGHAALAPAPAR